MSTSTRPFGFGYILAILMLWTFLDASAALAHKVTVFAWLEGDTVHTESKFSGGRRAKGATIEVYDAEEKLLLTGKTDDQGLFSFKIPKPSALKIVLLAGMGHRNQWQIQEAAVRQALAGTQSSPALPAPVSEVQAPQQAAAPQGPPSDPPPSTLSAAQVERIVNQSLDRKLAPLLSAMAEMRDPGPSVTDVLGGIGYILGLVGLGAYLNARRRRSGSHRDEA
jgi:nickel transport protein